MSYARREWESFRTKNSYLIGKLVLNNTITYIIKIILYEIIIMQTTVLYTMSYVFYK